MKSRGEIPKFLRHFKYYVDSTGKNEQIQCKGGKRALNSGMEFQVLKWIIQTLGRPWRWGWSWGKHIIPVDLSKNFPGIFSYNSCSRKKLRCRNSNDLGCRNAEVVSQHGISMFFMNQKEFQHHKWKKDWDKRVAKSQIPKFPFPFLSFVD